MSTCLSFSNCSLHEATATATNNINSMKLILTKNLIDDRHDKVLPKQSTRKKNLYLSQFIPGGLVGCGGEGGGGVGSRGEVLLISAISFSSFMSSALMASLTCESWIRLQTIILSMVLA